jgi:hypothetical protein
MISKHLEARERAKELAVEGCNVPTICKMLGDEGLGGLVDQFELEAIATESEFIRSFVPERPKKALPRVIGFMAVIMGAVAIYIGSGGPSLRRYSLSSYGILAVILGGIVIIKPSAAKEDL